MLDKSHLGLTHIYWGDGKGKTTAALGSAVRACGSDFNVHLIQFLKKTENESFSLPGEIKSLDHFPNFSFRRFGLDSFVKKPTKEHINEAEESFEYLKSALKKNSYDIVIADEILYAVQLGLLEEKKVIKLIKYKPKNKELILTGSHKPFPKIFQHADLVTEVKKHKHPFDNGVKARKGIEY